VPRLQLSTGRIVGEYVGGTEHFSSIPFAAPPLGERRWRKPAPVQPWEGELDCTSHRPPDDRRGRPVQWVDPRSTDRLPTEDCLYLDLWLPKGTAERSGKPLLPVLVWIYGGGLLGGSKDDPGSSGQCYAEQGIIYLSINYRVGALGFLCPKGGDANCGLWDQVAALQWVQKEIRAMGGDATRVTIMGQSAGGDSVYWLCASPVANKLFSRAIMMSPASFTITPEQAEELAGEFARNAGAKSAGLADMQDLSMEVVLKTQLEGSYRIFPTTGPGWRELMAGGSLPDVDPEPVPSAAGLFQLPEGYGVRGWPMPVAVVDGEFLKEPPLLALTNGVASHLEPRRACNGSCGRFVPADEPRSDLIRRMAWEIVGSPALLNSPFEAAQQCVRTDLIPAYEEELGSDASQPQLLHDAIATDFSFLAKVQLISERLSASGQCKSLFRYQFDGYRGRDAFHGSELTLLLGVPGDGVERRGSPEVRQQWMSSWMAFVHTGNPNIAEMRGKWQQFGPSSVVMRWDGFDGWVEDAKFLEHRKGLLATARLWERLWKVEAPSQCSVG